MLVNLQVKNHFSALQHPVAVEKYLAKERSYRAILGPTKDMSQDPSYSVIHSSPLLTRPKDQDKCRVILDLSYPQGLSLNNQVDKLAFDTSSIVKFPSIDNIVQELSTHWADISIAKYFKICAWTQLTPSSWA